MLVEQGLQAFGQKLAQTFFYKKTNEKKRINLKTTE
jgi:hypothetical protein